MNPHGPLAAPRDPVAAIGEQEARGEIADLYTDIRATLGVPVVNLVWRHLASVEGALPWAWQAVRPAYRSGAVARHAERLKAGLVLPRPTPVPLEVFNALGLAPAARSGLINVIDSYDRSNPLNWLALSALLRAGDEPERDGAANDASAATGRGATSERLLDFTLPSLLALGDMAPATALLVNRLNALGNDRDDNILASMYRHLAHWPPLLALMWAQMSALDADGQLRSAALQVAEHGGREARELRASLAPVLPHPEGRAALADFMARIGLPRMIAITSMLRLALQAARD